MANIYDNLKMEKVAPLFGMIFGRRKYLLIAMENSMLALKLAVDGAPIGYWLLI